MPAWLKNVLYIVMLICCVIIGMRVYLEMDPGETDTGLATGAADNSSIPLTLAEFSLNDVWGEPHSIREWSGRPLLINFWATWCAPCRREMPLLQALHESQDELQVLGIAIDRQPDVQTYLAEAGITYPSLVGEQDAMAVSELFGLSGLGLPFTVLVSSDGTLLSVFIGEFSAAELETLVSVSRQVERGELDSSAARQQLAGL